MKSSKYIACILASYFFQTTTIAETKYEIEIDPTTYALDGYSFHARVAPDSLPNWRLGVGIYSMEFPDLFIDMNSQNKDRGWNVDLDQGIGLFAEYYFNRSKKGWLAGTQIAKQNFKITNTATASKEEEFSNLLIMPYLGYRWKLSEHLYAQSWFGVGYADKLSGNTQIGNNAYDIDPIVPFGAVHIGYSF